ncbi:MAG: hypothetical protein QM778_27955 [Myxococcales bacterium]
MTPERHGLSEEAAALLEAAREEYSPQAHELANVQAALKAKFAHAAVSRRSAWWREIVRHTVHAASWQWMAATALASGLVVGAATIGPLARKPSTGSDEVALPVHAARHAAKPGRRPPKDALGQASAGETNGLPAQDPSNARESPALLREAPPGAVSTRSVERTTKPASTKIASRTGDANEPSQVTHSLEQETALLRRARERLASGAPGEALELLDLHAARFSQGTLRQERLFLRVLALCALERTADARTAAGQLSLPAGSPYRQRLAHSCVEP